MKYRFKKPLAIAMWDFSWLERRWTGAGYEDWEQVLDELIERGYNAVRIDAYPHLLSADPNKEWVLKPQWNQQVWGAPALTKISRIKDNLIEFMSICKKKNIKVGLSTWYRQDIDDTRMKIATPHDLAHIWKTTLDTLKDAGLFDIIFYVDFCNEYPLRCWAPFLPKGSGQKEVLRISAEATRWMKESIAEVRQYYPDMKFTFSITSDYDTLHQSEYDTLDQQDVSFMDVLEPHIWMVQFSDFYAQVGYAYECFDSKGYDNLALYAEDLYHSNSEHWIKCLYGGIDLIADWSRKTNKPLITTECWGIIDYKDWPLLNWDWVKELCVLGVKRAVSKERWIAIATSNFCGPQFVGMWRNIAWHKELTDIIKNGKMPNF
jgi:hypothetical protein